MSREVQRHRIVLVVEVNRTPADTTAAEQYVEDAAALEAVVSEAVHDLPWLARVERIEHEAEGSDCVACGGADDHRLAYDGPRFCRACCPSCADEDEAVDLCECGGGR